MVPYQTNLGTFTCAVKYLQGRYTLRRLYNTEDGYHKQNLLQSKCMTHVVDRYLLQLQDALLNSLLRQVVLWQQ